MGLKDLFNTKQQITDDQRSDLQKYQDMLATSRNRVGGMTALGGLYNLGVVADASRGKKTKGYVAPTIDAPFYASPGPEIAKLQERKDIETSSNTSRKIAVEMGRPELLSSINAAEIMNKSRSSAEGLLSTYDVMNKNIEASNSASNINASTSADVYNKNIEKVAAENAQDSDSINQALGQIYQMGGNLMNTLNISDYYSMMAGKMYDNQTMGRSKALWAGSKLKK